MSSSELGLDSEKKPVEKAPSGGRKYLSESELGLGGATPSKESTPVGGKKYLSAEDLSSVTGSEEDPNATTPASGSRNLFGRVVMPEAANKIKKPGKYDDGDVNGTLVAMDLDDLDDIRKPSPNDTFMNIPGVSIAQAAVPTTANPARTPKAMAAAAAAADPSTMDSVVSLDGSESQNVISEDDGALQRGVASSGRRGQASASLELSPLSQGVMAYLDAHLPEEINFMPEDRCREVIESIRGGASYSIGAQLARGAESLLYQGKCEGYNFLVKSIRNWKDHWIGDTRTRKDTGKLSDSVEYETKMRHLNNEWSVGQKLRDDSGNAVPVQIYSMRRVTRVGFELGWDLLMERINGIDLSDKKLVGAMTIADKVRVCIRMAQAIGILHAKRLVHLDIKPSNFILDRNGVIRLIDFGISVGTGYQSRTVAGTAGYFSPEQISCKTLSEDTDVFALGVTFNVLFGGRILVQTPDEAKSRQYRHDALSDLEKNNFSAIGDIPELGMPYKPLAEVIRSCSILRRASRISNCVVLVNKLRQAAEECGIQL